MYRNLLPAPKRYSPEDRDPYVKRSKYRFDEFMIDDDHEVKGKALERRVYGSRRKQREVGELMKAEESFKKNRKGRTMEDIEKEDEIESESDEEKGYHEAIAKKKRRV